MGHRQYSGNHPRFSKRADERYDAKEAYNKDLSDSARLHYLENVRHDHESPADMHCSPVKNKVEGMTHGELAKFSESRPVPAGGKTGYERHMEMHKSALNMRYGVSRHKSGHLDAYEGVDPKSLHPYDDGAGGIDYEAMDRDNKMMMQKDVRPKEKIRSNMAMQKDIRPKEKIKVKSYTQEAKPIPKKRSYTKELKAIPKKKATSPVNQGSPMKMEGKGCAKSEGGSGCVVKRGGEYVILNNKKGGIFQSGFKSKQAAERSLAGYHANK